MVIRNHRGGKRMTVQGVIRVCLVVILVCLIGVHWSLFTREWEQLRKKKAIETAKTVKGGQEAKAV